MSGRWFRYYEEALNDPKVQRLPDALFKAWVNLLCLASKTGGEIACLADVAFALRLPEPKAAAIVARLAVLELLDAVPSRYFAPHNWGERQYKSDVSNERVKRHRERKSNTECNVTSPVTETPPETEQIQNESETRAREDGGLGVECHAVAKSFLEAGKLEPDDPLIITLQYQVQTWINEKIPVDFIRAKGVALIAGKPRFPHVNYLATAIRNAWTDEQAAPKPSPNFTGASYGKTKSVQDVARELQQQFSPPDDGLDIPGFLQRKPLRAVIGG